MRYTEQEVKEMNQQLKRWQKRQLTVVRQNNVDSAFNKMSDIDRAAWEMIANAESYKDVNWLVWNEAERIIKKYYDLAR